MSSDENKIDPKFEKLARDTADLVKTGNMNEVLRVFKKTLGEDNPALIGAMKMIANAMKAKDDKAGAHRVYKNIYDIMCKQASEDNPEVLKASMDVIATTASVRDAYDMARKGLRIANTLSGEVEIKAEFETIKAVIFESLTPVLQRLYTKLETRKPKKIKKIAHRDVTYDVDAIMKEFGLED